MSEIRSSAEDYLEAILILREKKGYARSIDVAYQLGVSKPSVSVAMKNLRENGCVTVDNDGMIALLPKGQEIASRIYERHQVLTRLFTALGVPEEIAAEDACRIEHVISPESFSAIKAEAAKAGLLEEA